MSRPATGPGAAPAGRRPAGADHPALAGFREPVRAWFGASFRAPTRAQALAWPVIRRGESALLVAPTGSGKTLAAFLAALDRLMFDPPPPLDPRGCRVLYVSPLKALAVDVDRNLRTPLAGIARWAERLGIPAALPEVAVRTGDTPARERARFARQPADILITTPESLYLLLTSRAREALRDVRTVILDEIHALVATKRGAHLALSLERLQALVGEPPIQRIGLSATLQPLDEAARYLGGYADPDARDGAAPEPRPVHVLDAGRARRLALTVEVPVEAMARSGATGPPEARPSSSAGPRSASSSIWPAMHPLILDLIRTHRTTLVFVNSRRLAERLAAALNELAEAPLVRAHHGSMAREQREEVEEALKAGQLPALVATSSLELGIDMGAIDLVIHVEAPPAVGSALQRIGRAGHQVGAASRGVILPKYRGDLLACAALTRGMVEGAVEPLRLVRRPLDVLAQQIVAMVAMEPWPVDALEAVVRRAASFADLHRDTLDGVLDMLSGRYPSDEFAELRPRVTWDRLAGTLAAREGSRAVAIANGGTIPDRGHYGVFLVDAPPGRGRVGELDEEMVFESRAGEAFVLGASTWRIEEITHDRVLVTPAPGVPGKLPFWHGDRAGRHVEFGRAIGALCRTLRALPPLEARRRLVETHALTEPAADHLLRYLADQAEAAGAVPDDRTVLVERSRDELGDWRICLLSPFGGRVHGPWALALAARLAEGGGGEHDVLWTDDGIVVRFPDTDQPPPVEPLFPEPEEVEGLVIRHLGAGAGARQAGQGAPATALFASRFREAAARALLLPRRRPGQRIPLWQQRKRAADLLRVAARYDTFPIVLETYRECLRDVFDLPALTDLLREVRSQAIRVVTVDSRAPSPFAAALLFTYVANFLYEGDAPLAERRAQALTVDPVQLRQLLGEVELRELVDRGILAALERHLQHLAPERAARHADGLHDLLLQLGDLTRDEVRARATDAEAAARWTDRLIGERRVVRLAIAGETRLAAAEDAGRYRDGLGLALPPDVPAAFLAPVQDPLGDLVSRYARTHGPFPVTALATRLGLPRPAVEATLARLAEAGRVVEGAFRPGGRGREWCDAEVLRTLRQRSLARLRREAAPVPGPVLGRFALAWHGIGHPRQGPEALLEVVAQLQGAALPASVLETDVLPARMTRYDPHDLDTLLAAGAVLWVGAGPLGPRDGRVALYLAEHAGRLLPAPGDPGSPTPASPLHDRIREVLAGRGASFFPQVRDALGGGYPPELSDALWDLVWAGEVTNDLFHPVRAVVRPRGGAERPGPGRGGARGGRGRERRGPARGARSDPGGLGRLAPEVAGRWSLVAGWRRPEVTPTERLAARVGVLLDRHGLLMREAVTAEGLEGGFAAVYPVLKALEDAGRVRRGYFVAGRGATQFARPGALDRLRALRGVEGAPEVVRLDATDPANPYGAALPWPERPTGRKPMRLAGALVVLVDGALAAWLGPGERQVLTFADLVPDRAAGETLAGVAATLAAEPARTGRPLLVEEVDGQPAATSALAGSLVTAGFAATPHGFLRRLAARRSDFTPGA